jgi:hypothetical protein
MAGEDPLLNRKVGYTMIYIGENLVVMLDYNDAKTLE